MFEVIYTPDCILLTKISHFASMNLLVQTPKSQLNHVSFISLILVLLEFCTTCEDVVGSLTSLILDRVNFVSGLHLNI